MTGRRRLGAALVALLAVLGVACGVGAWLPGRGAPHLDPPVLTFFAERRSGAWTAFFRAVTTVGAPGYVLLLVLLVAVLLLALRDIAGAALLAAAPLAADAVETLAKMVTDRPRPPIAERVAHVSAHGFSFPSGHATIAAAGYGALAVVLARRLHRAAAAAVVVVLGAAAGLVGVSRLYLGVHWLTDVLAGWLIGAATLAVAAYALGRRTSRLQRRPCHRDA
jgi:undecaprenyl-diphosphatase